MSGDSPLQPDIIGIHDLTPYHGASSHVSISPSWTKEGVFPLLPHAITSCDPSTMSTAWWLLFVTQTKLMILNLCGESFEVRCHAAEVVVVVQKLAHPRPRRARGATRMDTLARRKTNHDADPLMRWMAARSTVRPCIFSRSYYEAEVVEGRLREKMPRCATWKEEHSTGVSSHWLMDTVIGKHNIEMVIQWARAFVRARIGGMIFFPPASNPRLVRRGTWGPYGARSAK